MTPIRVMVVDDHAVVREGIRHVLSDAEAYVITGEAASAAEAIALVSRARPDVVVIDISMPGGSGLAAVPELLERVPTVRILVLSVHDDSEYVLESVRSGAHGYLRKDSTPAELRAAIASVHTGGRYYSPPIGAAMAEALSRDASQPARPPAAARVLTPRELEVLRRVARGATSRVIGAALGISARTVEAHRDSLMRKLGVRTVAGLTRLAIEQGLLADSEAGGARS